MSGIIIVGLASHRRLGIASNVRHRESNNLDEPVHLSEHDPHWIEDATLERGRILDAIGGAAIAAEHVGSTAIPGLSAKPVIDLMVGLAQYPPGDLVLERLKALGYTDMGEAGVSGRSYLRLRARKSFNAHLVQHEGRHWKVNLALRTYLARSASARERYTNAKTRALEAGANTLLSYSAAKATVLEQLVQEALRADGDA